MDSTDPEGLNDEVTNLIDTTELLEVAAAIRRLHLRAREARGEHERLPLWWYTTKIDRLDARRRELEGRVAATEGGRDHRGAAWTRAADRPIISLIDPSG